jgi:hypothetical protein
MARRHDGAPSATPVQSKSAQAQKGLVMPAIFGKKIENVTIECSTRDLIKAACKALRAEVGLLECHYVNSDGLVCHSERWGPADFETKGDKATAVQLQVIDACRAMLGAGYVVLDGEGKS